MLANRFELVINTYSLKERDALIKLFCLVGTFMDEEAFHALVAQSKKQNEEAAVDGKHVRKRLTIGEQEAANAERYAEMERKGIKPTREGTADTGQRAFSKEGVENVVIDALLSQLEEHYDLFGVRLEQKAAKYTSREVKEARRAGLKVKPGDYKKTEKGGEVFLYKFRFFFFKKGSSRVVQQDLFLRLKGYGDQAIHQRAHGFHNDQDNDVLELSLGNIKPNLWFVTRVLYDKDGFYSRSIPNNMKGRTEPVERHPSLTASLGERFGNGTAFGIPLGKKPDGKNGDTPPPAAS